MPELPDIELYCGALRERVIRRPLVNVRVLSSFLLRTVDPPLEAANGRTVIAVSRLGKRIVLGLDGDLHLVIHLMIAGRLRWLASDAKPPGKIALAVFDFPDGRLVITEAGTKRRAALHLVAGRAALSAHNPGGLEPLTADLNAFAGALRRENHTLKRALTDPRLFSGIGNAYSDEILHAARLSPVKWTQKLNDDEIAALHAATIRVLSEWTAALSQEFAGRFPGAGDITAFRPDFAAHGRYGLPCPVCGTAIQRIRYAENETNYCARCQVGGKVLADRSLSRLLKDDWPRSIESLEEHRPPPNT
ncbi:MAG: Fpg/Nei family DNA glycosylase [Planctomycetia bacterium]|nr:Fpg/Nei family DNA glycosylase [Planctomycetia bacterium]MCC7315028.1 Fpg/Nei family DNA glycosylase [Planctomycetota bacterium]